LHNFGRSRIKKINGVLSATTNPHVRSDFFKTKKKCLKKYLKIIYLIYRYCCILLCQLTLSFTHQCSPDESFSFVDHDDDYKKNSGNQYSVQTILQRYNSRSCGKYLKISNSALSKVEQEVFTAESILETLDLSNNNIKKIDVDAFVLLNKLVNLDLSDNDLQQINEHIFNKLHNLQNINLENNQLTEIKMTFYNSQKKPLKKLTLSGNNILKFECSEIRFSNGNGYNSLALNELHLSTNPTLNLSNQSFWNYANVMTHLYLDGVSLSNYKSISPLQNLEELSIGNDQLESFECNQLPSLRSLKNLIINGKNINIIDCSSLKTNLPRVSRVEISKNLINRSNLRKLRKELTSYNVVLYQSDESGNGQNDLVKLELLLSQTNEKLQSQIVLIFLLGVFVVIILITLVWMFFYHQWNNKQSKNTGKRSQKDILNTLKSANIENNKKHHKFDDATQNNKIQFVFSKPHLQSAGFQTQVVIPSTENIDQNPVHQAQPSNQALKVADENEFYSEITYFVEWYVQKRCY
jgi:Leucine-rich repeat (LRR) protein